MIQLEWYKLGYENYEKFLSRKYICYSGKRIMFSWNLRFFQEVMLTFCQVGSDNFLKNVSWSDMKDVQL